MRGLRIKLDDDLAENVKQCAAKAGYSSPEEFVIHVLEKETALLLTSDTEDDEEVKKRLRGLGYVE